MAAKSTLMKRMTSIVAGGGETYYDGARWEELPNPRRTVGLYLGSAPFHAGVTVGDRLSLVARVAGASAARVG